MHRKVLSLYYQVVVVAAICMLTWVSSDALPVKTEERSNHSVGKTRLAIQVLRTAREFTAKDPKREIETVILKTSKHRDDRAKDYVDPKVPWLVLISNFRRRKRNRTRRRRHKRGARINYDESFDISEQATNKRKYRLANRLGFYLRIHMNGTIDGTTDSNDPRTKLWIESHAPSIIRIKGEISENYITIDRNGIPSAERFPPLMNSLFRLTQEENAWDTYASYRYYFERKYDMLIGITKNATVKSPWKAISGQYATQFLSIGSDA